MKRILLTVALLVGLSGAAEAACSGTSAQMKDNAAATFSMGLSNDPNGNCVSYSLVIQGASLLSVTNGLYTNLLQGNAVLSATNPLFVSPATSAIFQVQSNSANLATQTTAASILSAIGTPMQQTGGSVTANAGTNLNTSTLALETGGNLATIATNTGKIPSQGQALAAASVPVVLTALQITALTPPTTVAVTQSTSPWIVAGGGTAGTPGTAVLTVQGVSGGTAVPVSLAANQSVNLTQLNSVALGSPSNYGTSPGAVAVQGVNAFVTNTVPVTLTSTTITGTVAATQSGTWTNTVTQATGTNLHMVCDSGCSGSGGTSSTFGSAFPSTGTAIGLTNGTNMIAWSATSNYGTAPSAIAVPAVNAFITGAVGLAQGATTSGVTGSLVLCSTTTSATGGSTATVNPLNCGTGGLLRVDASGANITIGTNAALVAGSAIIGKVGIDQTTVGITNGISIADIGSNAALSGTGAVGAGALRIAVGQDTATIAGSAPGTAGTPSANVITIQGTTGGTTVPVVLTAGSALAGKVGIDQTTVGTTNGVSLAQIGATTISTGAGVTGTGTQRVGVAQDTTTIAGSAPGTAGAPSSNVVTIQGSSGGTSVPANLAAAASGGCSQTTIFTAASNNATVVGTAAAHTLCFIRWENTTTSVFSIRTYDTATSPSAGAPCNSATGLQSADVAQSNATSPGGVANEGPFGAAFASGIVVCVTGANASNDNTNATTGLNLVVGWK